MSQGFSAQKGQDKIDEMSLRFPLHICLDTYSNPSLTMILTYLFQILHDEVLLLTPPR